MFATQTLIHFFRKLFYFYDKQYILHKRIEFQESQTESNHVLDNRIYTENSVHYFYFRRMFF